MRFSTTLVLLSLVALPLQASVAQSGTRNLTQGSPPKVGDTANDFTLPALNGSPVQLSDALKQGPVVLIFLRGYPGYQCPACTAQVADFSALASQFRDKGATVLYVYPTGLPNIQQLATQFPGTSKIVQGQTLLLDPNYKLVNAYNLRWNAPNETAYPSTFVINQKGTITYAKISKTHGGRAEAEDVLKALK